MVPFAGYSMPVQYSDLSVGESHKWTREKASLFDVGHMYESLKRISKFDCYTRLTRNRVQHQLSGPDVSTLLSRMTPTSIEYLKPNHSTLSCLLNPGTGGIVDDTVITRLKFSPATFYMVTNAACRDKDLAYISTQIKELGTNLQWEVLDRWGLVALQGPLSVEILQNMVADRDVKLEKLYFGQCLEIPLKLSSSRSSPPVLLSRGGYTGEDGFEISIPPDATVAVTEALLESAGPEKLRLAGLGARDSLRLEAGMCLYGHDLDDTTTPVEAGLSWIISKERRASGGFHGAEVILDQLKPKKDGGTGVSRKRVGLIVEGAPAQGRSGDCSGRWDPDWKCHKRMSEPDPRQEYRDGICEERYA